MDDHETAPDLRKLSDELRLMVLETHKAAGGGHLGSSLSIVEILAVLVHAVMHWPAADDEPWRGDRVVLSKGHAALALYCALAQAGRVDPARLRTFGANGSVLEPHPNERLEPALHASTGSLGQGMSIALGLALGARLRGGADRVFAIVGDGEVNEGQIWEAARSAATLGVDNLVVVLDDNRMQQDGPTPEIMGVADAVDAWRGMGWACRSVDGHDCAALLAALAEAAAGDHPGPRLVHARTVKGRGVAFLEDRTESHFPPPLTDDDLALVRYGLVRP